jgi:SAM-dependent methyltransferase
MSDVREFVDPFNRENPDFWIKVEHIGRYLFAAGFLKQLMKDFRVVLDAGCACGTGTVQLRHTAERIIGLDRSQELLNSARKRWICNSISFEYVDFKDNLASKLEQMNIKAVDAVVAFEVLEHLESPKKAVSDFYRILKHNGYLIGSVPNRRFESVSPEGSPMNPFHLHLFSLEQITSLLENAGFVIQDFYGQPMTNRLMKKENKLRKKNRLPMNSSTIKLLHSEDIVRYFGSLLALPEAGNLEDSYSFIFVAKKQ